MGRTRLVAWYVIAGTAAGVCSRVTSAGAPDVRRVTKRPPPVRSATAPTTQATVTFRRTAAEAGVPAPYRLADATFAYRQTLIRRGPRVDIFEVRYPSPVVSPHPENNQVYAEYYRPRRAGRVPGVVVLHVLKSRFEVARLVSQSLASEGVSALFIQMAYYGHRRPRGKRIRMVSRDVDRTLANIRQTVLDIRRGVAWLAAQPEIDPHRLGIVGVSLGSMTGCLAAEMEPRVRKTALVLSGGDFVRVLWQAPEARPLRAAWEKAGGTYVTLADKVRPVDPVTYAHRLKDREVFMINARHDEVIPRACTVRLWKALGQPRIVWLDSGHVGSARYVFHILHVLGQFFTNWDGAEACSPTTQARPAKPGAAVTGPGGTPP